MNESTLTQLKIIVERAVRPVRASTSHKRKMREELVAHVSAVFEEEAEKLGEERAALERTALRFGNPAEVTGQLQESVPASDGIARFWEGRPDESMLRGALRFAWIESALCLIVLAVALFVAGWVSPWSREELSSVVSGWVFLPLWILVIAMVFFGIALVAHWMEKSLQSPHPVAGWPRIGLIKFVTSAWAVPAVRVALIVGGLCMFLFFRIRNVNWPMQPDWDLTQVLAAVLFAGMCASWSVLCAWLLVQTVAERRRYLEEWSRLPIEPTL